MRMIWSLIPAMAAIWITAAEAQPSNEQFAAEVKRHRARFEKDPAVVSAAKDLCQNLAPDRWIKEPKCIALQRHISASATRSKGGAPRF